MDEYSKRFISAYNKIDRALRNRLNLKPNISFSDCIRRAAAVFNTVKKHEDDLYAFARLRNAIVHSAADDETIAEPHLKTVQKIEAIEALILTPPKALDYAKKAQVLAASESLLNAVITMSQNGYSNMPVVSDSGIIGVITNKLIVKALSKLLLQKHDAVYEYMASNTVASALTQNNSHYIILNSDATVDEVLNCFFVNPKLQIVILRTLKSGEILGVITTGDVAKLNEVMDG